MDEGGGWRWKAEVAGIKKRGGGRFTLWKEREKEKQNKTVKQQRMEKKN